MENPNDKKTTEGEQVPQQEIKAEGPLESRGQQGESPREEAPVRSSSGQGPRGRPRFQKPREVVSDFVEKVVRINRVAKVTKGGKKLSFSALVVVGDAKGHVGYAQKKANDVATAIRKSMGSAKKAMVTVPLNGTTITHEIMGRCGAAKVLLKPASEGTGVIAAGPVRAICDAVGIRDILTKCHTSNNPLNVIKATMDGLNHLKKRSSILEAETPNVHP